MTNSYPLFKFGETCPMRMVAYGSKYPAYILKKILLWALVSEFVLGTIWIIGSIRGLPSHGATALTAPFAYGACSRCLCEILPRFMRVYKDHIAFKRIGGGVWHVLRYSEIAAVQVCQKTSRTSTVEFEVINKDGVSAVLLFGMPSKVATWIQSTGNI